MARVFYLAGWYKHGILVSGVSRGEAIGWGVNKLKWVELNRHGLRNEICEALGRYSHQPITTILRIFSANSSVSDS